MRLLLALAALLLAPVAAAQLTDPSHKYNSSMPPTSDPELLSLFANPAVQWYTEDEIAKVYQHHLSGYKWISVYKKISPGYAKRTSNGNGEWPWAHPAVMSPDNDVKNVVGILNKGMSTFDTFFDHYSIGISGPRQSRYVSSLTKRGGESGTGWRYAEGTEFVELVTNKIGQYDFCFKVHRMTMRDNEWFFRVYRPFRSQDEYEAATSTTVPPAKMMQLIDTTHDIPAVEVRGIRQHTITQPITATMSKRLLTQTPFELCSDEDFIPTTDHKNQIWPVGYLGAFLGNATIQDRCRNCHRDVAVHVGKHSTGDWYGQIRGGGKDRNGVGVFSHRPLLRTWYGRGQQPTESPSGQRSAMMTRQPRMVRQPQQQPGST